jgi:hypothetical protein
MYSQRFVQGNRMADCRSLAIGRHDPYFTDRSQGLGEGCEAGRVNAVVIGHQDARTSVRHKKSCSLAAHGGMV